MKPLYRYIVLGAMLTMVVTTFVPYLNLPFLLIIAGMAFLQWLDCSVAMPPDKAVRIMFVLGAMLSGGLYGSLAYVLKHRKNSAVSKGIDDENGR